MTNEYLSTMTNISITLSNLGIEHDLHPLHNGYQITFPWCSGDIAMHPGTYCSEDGYVESYQCPWDGDDVSVLTPDEMLWKVVKEYLKEGLG